jgi:hypothetical protein
MIKLVPEQYQRELSMAIAKGELDNVKKIVEQNNIDVDAFVENDFYEPVVMKILLSYGILDEGKRLDMLRYVLEKGANPNTKCKNGYNCLHIAIQQEKLINALDLFLNFNGDVNITDRNGATVAYWAIQSFPWRKEGEERQFHLDVVEKILMLGADLDYKNKFGVTPRKWLEHTSEDVRQIVAKCEKLKPVYKPSKTLQPDFPTKLQHPEIAKKIWKELVPPIGQADTVQGELLRAVEKLRDEAQRNGNINYFDSHKLLAKFISDTLVNSELFDKKEIAKIKSESKKLMKASSPYIDDDVYDYLTDQICVFYLKNIELVRHEQNPSIVC